MKEYQHRILSTKPIPQIIIDRAAGAGILIDAIPFITTLPIQSESLGKEIKGLAGEARDVVFTSAKSVAAVADQLRELPKLWHVHCIGGSTLDAVRDRLPGVPVVNTADDAASLAGKIKEQGNVSAVVFFCGNISMPILDTTLASTIEVKRVIVYQTTLSPSKVTLDYDAILFFSPSAVDSYLSINHILPRAVLFAIGKTTAAQLKQYPNTTIIAHTPDANGMVQQVIDHFIPVKAGASPLL